MRQVANKAKDPALRRHFSTLAAEYDRLADHVEKISRQADDRPAWRPRRVKG